MGGDIPRMIWSQLSRIMSKSGSGSHPEAWKSIQISYIQSYTMAPVLKINQTNLVGSFQIHGRQHSQNDMVTTVPDHVQIRIRITPGSHIFYLFVKFYLKKLINDFGFSAFQAP